MTTSVISPIATVDIPPNDQGKYVCPECGKEFNDTAHLGLHRKSHGVQGSSHQALRRLKLKASRGSSPGLKLSQAVVDRIKRLFANGVARSEIASRVGVSYTTVRMYTTEKKAAGLKVSAADVSKMRMLHKQGLTITEISEHTGHPRSTIHRYVRDIQAKVTKPKAKRVTEEEVQNIRRLLAEGKTVHEVSHETGRSPVAIYRQKKFMKEHTATQPIQPIKEISTNGNQPPEHDSYDTNIAYLYGRLEREAEIFSLRYEIPQSHVASGLATLFSLQAGRQGVRGAHRVPALPHKATRVP